MMKAKDQEYHCRANGITHSKGIQKQNVVGYCINLNCIFSNQLNQKELCVLYSIYGKTLMCTCV